MNPETLAIAVRDALDDLRLGTPSIKLADLQCRHSDGPAHSFDLKAPLGPDAMVVLASTANPSIAKLLLLLPQLSEAALNNNRLEQENAALRARVNQLTPAYAPPNTTAIKPEPKAFSVQAIQDHLQLLPGGEWYVENFGRGVWELYADNKIRRDDIEQQLHPVKILSVPTSEYFPNEVTASFILNARNHYLADLIAQVKAIPGASDLSWIRMQISDRLGETPSLAQVAQHVGRMIQEILSLRTELLRAKEANETQTTLLSDIVRSLGHRATPGEQDGDWMTLPQTVFALRRGENELDLRLLNVTVSGVVTQVKFLLDKQAQHKDEIQKKNAEISQGKEHQAQAELFQKVRILLGGVPADDALVEIQKLQEQVRLPPVVLQSSWPPPPREVTEFVNQLHAWLSKKENSHG